MNFLSTPEFWSIVSSFVSVCLALLAITLSVYFFVKNRNTEKDVSNSLVKIETQADILQKITAKQMDKLTKYVTEFRPPSGEETLPKLATILAEIPQIISFSLQTLTQSPDQEKLIDELLMYYIALYFYTAQTNYWSQHYLPNAEDYDDSNQFHEDTKRIVDMSFADFQTVAKTLGQCDQARLQKSSIYHLLEETKDLWRLLVKDSSGVFIERSKT